MINISPLIVVITGIVGLAMVAVLVSKKAQTPAVVTSTGSALASIINAAVAPVSSTGSNNFGG